MSKLGSAAVEAARVCQSSDDAMTLIVGAPDEYAARLVCGALPLRVLKGVADLCHVEPSDNRKTLTSRVVREARA